METIDPYSLVDEFCTHDQVKKLLHDAKAVAKNDVLIGVTKQDSLTNLEAAVSKGFVQRDEIWKLIRNGEENGDQHIFFYRARNASVRQLCNVDTIAVNLFGSNWESRFPKFGIPQDALAWSDFRRESVGWTGKLYRWHYSRKLLHEFKRHDDAAGEIDVFEYQIKKTRQICIARWQSHTLQIRVPRLSTRPLIREYLQSVWNELSRAGINRNDFQPIDLEKTRWRLIEEFIDGSDAYRPHALRLEDDDQCSVEITPHTEGDGLSDTVRQALRTDFAESDCMDLQLFVQPVEEILAKELRVQLLGRDENNEVVISSKTTPEAIDYVTGTLLQIG